MELNYKTKFNVGDTAWMCQKETHYLKCAACGGTGKIKIKNPIELSINDNNYLINEVVCPMCNNNEYTPSFWGPKENEKFKQFEFVEYIPRKIRIRSIWVEYDSDVDKFDTSYEIIEESKNHASVDSRDEYRIFSSLEECQHECDILNENNESYIKAKEHVYCG